MGQRAARRGTVIFLAIAVGVLVATTALFVVLYVTKQQDIGTVTEQIGTTERSIDDQSRRLATVRSAGESLATEQTQLTTANTKLRACTDAAKDTVTASARNDKDAFTKAMAKVIVHCRR